MCALVKVQPLHTAEVIRSMVTTNLDEILSDQCDVQMDQPLTAGDRELMARLMFGIKHYVPLKTPLVKLSQNGCKSTLAEAVLRKILPVQHLQKYAVVMAVKHGKAATERCAIPYKGFSTRYSPSKPHRDFLYIPIVVDHKIVKQVDNKQRIGDLVILQNFYEPAAAEAQTDTVIYVSLASLMEDAASRDFVM